MRWKVDFYPLKILTWSYWLVSSNRSKVKRFIENKSKDHFFKYMFIDSGEIYFYTRKELIVMTTINEFKKDTVKEEQK